MSAHAPGSQTQEVPMNPLAFRLPNIDEVGPFSEDDEACFEEIKQVLTKHGRLQRFGVCLLHAHFPITGDEVLVESCDPSTRTLTTRPVNRAQFGRTKPIETSWRLDTGEALGTCTSTPDGGHYSG